MSYVETAKRLFLETGTRFPRRVIWAMGLLKRAAAVANAELGLLERRKAEAIADVANLLAEGTYDAEITVDVFQTGSGTGLNMNVNEVIARHVASELGVAVHPNDDVNLCQSSNDVVPSAVRIAAVATYVEELRPELGRLIALLSKKSEEYKHVVKAGRTHLRDALPVTLGQELSGFADALARDLSALDHTAELAKRLPIGGTAVGTGVNAHPRFGQLVVDLLNEWTKLGFERGNPFAGMKLLTDLLLFSGAVRTLAVDMLRLGQDLRLMFSGPFTGLGEVDIPSQEELPGSSIMPGKTNPVTVEAVMQAAAYVLGLDKSIEWGASLGELELGMGIPLVGYSVVLEELIVAEALRKLADRVVPYVRPNAERMRAQAERSAALITLLAPAIGYDKAAELGKRLREGASIRDVLEELGLSKAEIDRLLDLDKMVEGGFRT